MRKPDNGRGGAFILPMIAILVVLGLLATFIIQNTQSIVINFLGWTGSAPLSATLLIAVAVGILLVTLFGAVRIMQLRRRVRKAAKS